MRKVRFLLVVFLVGIMWGWSKRSVLAVTVGSSCSSTGSISCCGSARCQCEYIGGYVGKIWVNIGNCTYGCSGGSCNPAPTPVPECTSGTKCVNSSVYTCVNYHWYFTSTCLYGCNLAQDGCAECSKGDFRCLSGNSQRCVNGFWKPYETCPYGCEAGQCVQTVACQCGDPGLVGEQCVTGYEGNISYTEVGGAIWTCSPNGECDIKTYCQASNFTDPCGSWGGTCEFLGSCDGDVGGSNENYFCRLIKSDSSSVCCKSLASLTCANKYSGSTCQSKDYCRDVYEMGSASDCTDSNSTCCTDTRAKECQYGESGADIFCQVVEGTICVECASDYTCKSTNTTGTCGSSAFSCSKGTATNQNTISNSGGITYTWDCTGSCVTSKSCSTGCSAENGVCNNSVSGGCSSGSPSTVTPQTVSTAPNEVGIVDRWSCNGSCNGTSQSGCSKDNCTNKTVTNGACRSVGTMEDVTNHTLCVGGTEANVVSDEATITWDCMGSTNTCAEGDGSDALGCSSDIDQDNWFQVKDGNILAKGAVNNYIPITTRDGGEVNLESSVTNGKIYNLSNSSTTGYDLTEKVENSDFSFKTYAYTQLKNDYLGKKGVGTTFGNSPDWSGVVNTTGIIFVEGDLSINSDLVTNNFVMIIAKGTITINSGVTEVDAALVADKVIAAAAPEDATDPVGQLTINGMVHGVNGVEFKRSLMPKSLNNTSPSVVVNYKPEILFEIPQQLAKSFSQWKVN